MKTTLFNTTFFLMLIFPLLVKGQYVTIKGYVTNEKNGTYLENVSLFESGSIIGTLTDKNGFFYLMLPMGSINISASLEGFQKFNKQITLESDTIFSIKLKPVEIKGVVKSESDVQALKSKEKELKVKRLKF